MTESRPARGVLPEHNRFLFQKLLIRSFVLPVIASVLLGASFVGMTVYLRSLSYWVDHTDVVIGEASRAELEMSGIQSSLANFLIFKGSVFLDQAKDKEEGMAQKISSLEELVSDNQPQVDLLVSIASDYRRWSDSVHAEISTEHGSSTPEKALIVYQRTEPLMREIRQKLPEVRGEGVQLERVFQNLVGNAIKFRKGRPHIVISAGREGAYWRFCVEDNGIGIEGAYTDKIFGLFQRLNKRTDYPGSGIGLAVCKTIIEYHGGKLWVESEENKGSKFYFTLRPINSKEEVSDAKHTA